MAASLVIRLVITGVSFPQLQRLIVVALKHAGEKIKFN